MTSRLNARIDDELARKLEMLQERTGDTVSGVVKASIERYYAEVVEQATPRDVLERTGFIGCAEGPKDLASTYKARLTKSLASKHRS